MASLKISVRLISGEELCSIEAEPDWTVAMIKDAILPNLPEGRFLKGLLLASQQLNTPDQMLSELGFTSECENCLSAVLQQGVPAGHYEGEAYGRGWVLDVSAASSYNLQQREGDLNGEEIGHVVGDILFVPCSIDGALGLTFSISELAGTEMPEPHPYFHGAVMFPEDGKMVLKTQMAALVLAGHLEPTMPEHMEEETHFKLVTYSFTNIEAEGADSEKAAS